MLNPDPMDVSDLLDAHHDEECPKFGLPISGRECTCDADEINAQTGHLRGEVARLQSERDELGKRNAYDMRATDDARAEADRYADRAELAEAELSRVRAEVTAAKADALEAAANAAGTFGGELAHTNVASVQRWLRGRAADTRAELEGGQR